MHDMFADWYRLVDLQPEGATLRSRWQVISKFAKNASLHEWLDTVRLFLRTPAERIATAKSFAQGFKTEDPLFSLGNDAEIGVLAGAALMHVLASVSPAATTVALALVSCSFDGKGQHGPIPDLLPAARKYLAEEGLRIRERAAGGLRSKLGSNPFKVSMKVEITAVTPNPQWPTVDANFTELAGRSNDLLAAARKMFNHVASVVDALEESGMEAPYNALREETNILWWLFGERSRDLNVPFDELGYLPSLLLIPKEAADLTTLLPGPVSITAVLAKASNYAGKGPKQVSLRDAVNAAPREWRETWMSAVDINEIADLVPVLSATKQSLSTAEPETWIPAYDKARDIKASTSLPPRNLAHQAYNEILLLRSLTKGRV